MKQVITVEVPESIEVPWHLLVAVNILRAKALTNANFYEAVMLTHIHAWLYNCDKGMRDAEAKKA